MNVIYAPEPIVVTGVSVFLAGPTSRSQEVVSWRPDALRVFERLGFEGTVLVPENRSGLFQSSYDQQIEWEEQGLHAASCIMFWVPRSLPHMPAFTTNDEWGTWKASGKVVWGNPPEAVKVTYQRYYAEKLGVEVSNDLETTVRNAVRLGQLRNR